MTKAVGLLLAATLLTCGGAPLSKIRISTDGRTFETVEGKPFVPFGVNYFRPGTGWAPQIWKQFDAEATRKDFARMKELGVNCVRVFLTYGSIYNEPGKLDPEGIAKFDKFLEMAEAAGIYVHPTGPEFWEGPPHWRPLTISDKPTLDHTVEFWKLFAARYKNRSVIFAYDLKNEPAIEWNNEILVPQWHAWLKEKYHTPDALAKAWQATNSVPFDEIKIPPPKGSLTNRALADFQSFREDIADNWTRRQAEAIKAADSKALVTVGYLQTSVPSRFWENIGDYTGFRPSRQAKYLDFLEIHFYPSERGGYEYKSEDDELANLAYLEGIVREMAKLKKPVVLAEFGWYGGAEKPKFDHGAHPIGTEEQQAKYLRRAIETSAGFVVGWLNWGLYDTPQATDCSELTGLLTVDGKTKAWGKTFQQLSAHYSGTRIPPPSVGPRPDLDWEGSILSSAVNNKFRKEYFEQFKADKPRYDQLPGLR